MDKLTLNLEKDPGEIFANWRRKLRHLLC